MSIFRSTSLRNLFGLLSVSAALYFGAFFAFRADSESRFTKYKLSSSSGSFTTTSTSYSDVTNLSVAYKATGRPVVIELVTASGASFCGIHVSDVSADGTARGDLKLLRDATDLTMTSYGFIGMPNSAFTYHGCNLRHVDTSYTVGSSYTYKLQAKVSVVNDLVGISNVKLLVYELP